MRKNKAYKQKRPFRERIAAFMYGRNGFDNLCNFIWILCIILVLVNLFIGSIIISVIETVLMVYTVFRSMSRKIYKRQKENAAYLKIKRKFTGFFKLRRNKWRDRKTHVYFKCTKCKSVLRVPRGKGSIIVTCPKCGERIEKNT